MKNIKKFDPENWDWYAFLASDEKTKSDNFDKADSLAGSWVTCACGQLCSSLPRTKDNGPKDGDLKYLGLQFYDNIEIAQWDEAKETLDKIEERTSHLLQLQSKLQNL